MYENTEFTLSRDCEAIQIPSGQKTTIPAGTQGVITQSLEEAIPSQLIRAWGAWRERPRRPRLGKASGAAVAKTCEHFNRQFVKRGQDRQCSPDLRS